MDTGLIRRQYGERRRGTKASIACLVGGIVFEGKVLAAESTLQVAQIRDILRARTYKNQLQAF